jgi:hypothetical protein
MASSLRGWKTTSESVLQAKDKATASNAAEELIGIIHSYLT